MRPHTHTLISGGIVGCTRDHGQPDPSTTARIVRDVRDANLDKFMPLAEAKALFDAGKLVELQMVQRGWKCYAWAQGAL